jgi:hypothetical protein
MQQAMPEIILKIPVRIGKHDYKMCADSQQTN